METDFLQTLSGLSVPTGGADAPMTMFGGTAMLAQSAFVLVSWWKVIILLAPFVAWGWLVSTVFDKHADRFHLGQEKWGSVHMVFGLVAVVAAFAIPIPAAWGFLVGFLAAVVILFADVLIFTAVTNKDERVPEEHRLKLDMSAMSDSSARRKAAKQAATVSLAIQGPDGTIPPPNQESPEYLVRAEAESVFIKARENRASRVMITARQGEGSAAELIIDGVRHPGESFTTQQAKAVIDFWKSCAGLDVSDVRRRLVGEVTVVKDSVKTKVRLVSIGHQGGLRLTMQINPAESVTRKADALGMTDEQLSTLKELVNSGKGVVLLAGTPQGGRTTTLYAVSQMHDAYTQNVQTVETEPLRELEGIRQIDFDPTGEETYAKVVRSNLRRDPDVLAVAELPDSETANEVASADLEQSRVYVSIAADSALNAVRIWTKAVGDPALAAKGLQGVVAQRMVRHLCGNCRVPYQPPAELVKKLQLPSKLQQLYKKGGQVLVKNKPEVCPVCNGLGYEGQIGVFEVYAIGKDAKAAIAKQDWNGLKTEMRKAGTPSIQQSALLKAVEGMTTIEEVSRLSAAKKS